LSCLHCSAALAFSFGRKNPPSPGVEVHAVDRPGLPFQGAAEAAQGPTAAALANAFADAAGIRLRDMRLSPKKVKAAIGGRA
jgi:CO/xanthine dehydrogenase Mo-binding subunit